MKTICILFILLLTTVGPPLFFTVHDIAKWLTEKGELWKLFKEYDFEHSKYSKLDKSNLIVEAQNKYR